MNTALEKPEIILSFCIPTFNRCEFISCAIESILDQTGAESEIIIVDGGSVDGTRPILEGYMQRSSKIKVIFRQKNFGVDLDLLEATQNASGTFCWLMSDDDALEPGAVAYTLALLMKYPTITGISMNYRSYDRKMAFPVANVRARTISGTFDDRYYAEAESCFAGLGMHLGYISAQVVNRELWLDVIKSDNWSRFDHSSWLMTYLIGRMMQTSPGWMFSGFASIKNRTNNDSFVQRIGEFKRQLITHESFPAIVKDLFGPESPVVKSITRDTIKYRMPRNLAKLKANGAPIRLQIDLLILYTRLYKKYPQYWIRVFPLFLTPNFLWKGVKALYFKYAALKSKIHA